MDIAVGARAPYDRWVQPKRADMFAGVCTSSGKFAKVSKGERRLRRVQQTRIAEQPRAPDDCDR